MALAKLAHEKAHIYGLGVEIYDGADAGPLRVLVDKFNHV
jgi:hypothetical protein